MSGTRPRVSRTRLAIIMVLTFAILGARGLYLFAQSRTMAAVRSTDRDPPSGLSRAMTFTRSSEPKR